MEAGGRVITEYEYILSEGNVPLKNNLIRRIVRNVIGVFREKLKTYMKEMYGGPLALIAEANSLEEIFTRSMEEFLISGMVVHRKRVGIQDGRPGVWTDIVSPGSFFFNTDSRDIRGRDVHTVGQIHRVEFNDWCKAFVKSPEDFKRAKSLFDGGIRHLNVTELWRKETVARYIFHDREAGYIRRLSEKEGEKLKKTDMPRKWTVEEVWRYYFLTDDGRVIASGDSPYAHGGHPYVFKCYPFLDGEIQSFVGDMIDQQRYTNRLITMYDWVIRASAKGVLLLPEGSVEPKHLQAVADQWSRFNGVIIYKSDPSRPEPKQVNSSVSNLGITELLQIQLKMLEDVSGVNGILQGNTSGGNVSGTLYDSQTTNAMYSLTDLLETFRVFIADCAFVDKALALGTQL